MPHRHFRIAAFDLRRIYHFINSVAYAQAAQNHTKLSWQAYKDSAVLNAIYFVMYWKGAPGTVEVSQDTQLIEARRSVLMRHYWNWIRPSMRRCSRKRSWLPFARFAPRCDSRRMS